MVGVDRDSRERIQNVLDAMCPISYAFIRWQKMIFSRVMKASYIKCGQQTSEVLVDIRDVFRVFANKQPGCLCLSSRAVFLCV